MASRSSSFRAKTLRRANSPSDYKLYHAALQWDLIDPIVIEDRKDLKSEYRWRDRVEPYHHQITNLITFCRRLPVTLLADDVGLGKTISAGLVVSELIARGRLSKILIVCPKILREQWKEELDTKFNISSVIATGKELISAKPPSEGGAVITTYHSARLYLGIIKKSGFDMLILDEAHKLRNLYGVDPAPQVAQRFREALSDRLFKYVLMLTATPIQNRLWDLYSLVDLLTVARGHENPFGSVGVFARKFIADKRNEARHLKPEMRDEFRSIVYSYMSRIRRGDANLHFPERVVLLHSVNPTAEEIELINVIAKPIQELNYLAQVVILQALISSPEALVALLNGMAKKGNIPTIMAANVRDVAKRISMTAKLQGLSTLIDKLRKEQSEKWRMVIFTRWRETQTTIQSFLEDRGIACGLINGDSGSRNQETIKKFKKDQPEINVIVSTEAGSEGVNLQAANVLVNYDLPWNPMIVEQRIGRIQRLSSNFAKVSIFNVVLKGTFEEYIVGRLMEKLQMASHAIGDVEALLEASGIDEGEEGGSTGFEEKIRQLVVASLAGKDVEQATRKEEKSILDAKTELEREEKNINSLLGKMDGAVDDGPKCPKLPNQTRSMDMQSFVLAALENLGANIISKKPGMFISELEGTRELIRFDNGSVDSELKSTLFAPGTSAFEQLVSRIANKDLHYVHDIDNNPTVQAEDLCRNWVGSFEGVLKSVQMQEIWRCFEGVALVRVRATVACDSYERLVEVKCSSDEHHHSVGRFGLEPINDILENPTSIGINVNILNERAKLDQGIAEFSRFYMERRAQELQATGDDERKRKKIDDDFTPRLEVSLAGLEGVVNRLVKMELSYNIESDEVYKSFISLIPSKDTITSSPEMAKCEKTGKLVPQDCLGKCEISGAHVLRHLLVKSEISDRNALPEYIIMCSLSGKRVFKDEVETSSVTGQPVVKSLLKTSALSGKRGEPQFFSHCEFTSTEVLESELAVSQISGKHYRIDEQSSSAVSGKVGHRQEFIVCAETKKLLLPTEAERCEATGKIVMPGILEKCSVTGKKVLPSELEKSSVSGRNALKTFFILSSVSGARLLEEEAVKSIAGKFCAPLEARACVWSDRQYHPDDMRTCQLTGLQIHVTFMATNGYERLGTLVEMLEKINRKSDKLELWPVISEIAAKVIDEKKCNVQAAELSPSSKHIAVHLEIKTWGGLKTRYAGFLFSIKDVSIVGRVAIGRYIQKNGIGGWVLEKNN